MDKKSLSKHLLAGIFLTGIFMLQSCMHDETWVEQLKPNLRVEDILAGRGVLVLNEGNFMYGNSSLSYYNSRENEVLNDVFYRQNGIPLGDVAQSASLFDGELFIVLNNSGKIAVVNFGKYPALKAFEFIHKISGLQSPRYISFIDSTKAYVSDLYARGISIIDPATYSVYDKISLANNTPDFYQHPTEQIIQFENEVFTNCYSFDDKILVINSLTDKLIDSITVLQQPNSMVLDRFGKLWVICDGGFQGSAFGNSEAGLIRIDAGTHTVEKIFILPSDSWPSKLCINGGADTLYFINGDVWRMPVTAKELPDQSFISAGSEKGGKLFYGLGVDPVSSEVYVSDAIDHTQNGVVYRFRPDGSSVDTFRVGIIPGFFFFFGE
ncbi:MAG: YncE family protein [Bacteroidales bacterium]|nr:YncE family protein [Bacteroidales bacterium]MCB8999947.1 YncE family protein [Bacteroidales bacterium]MCB9012602.1 YncE family protein [Bacteroidales bacterium]